MQIDKQFESLVFPLESSEYALLEQNIIKEGCRDALVVWREKDILLDGHNRYKICKKHNLPYKEKTISLESRDAAEDWIDANQLGRRNLSPDMMRLVRGRLYNRTKTAGHGAGSAAQIEPQNTADRIAKASGVSAATVKRDAAFAKEIEKKPELMRAIRDRVPVKKMEKEQRTIKLKTERAALAKKAEDMTQDERWLVAVGDIQTYKTKAQHDFIITDPPYPKEYLPLYETLAKRANEFLKDGGLLVTMCGQSYLDEIYELMSQHLDYYWTACYHTPGQPTPLRNRQVNTTWKPLLMFTKKGQEYKGKIFGDVYTSDQNEKTHHEWQQSESGMLSVISSICLPGQSIFDPFCGSSTTGIAAYKHGCIYHGIDLDKQNVDISNGRFAELISNTKGITGLQFEEEEIVDSLDIDSLSEGPDDDHN